MYEEKLAMEKLVRIACLTAFAVMEAGKEVARWER